MKLFSYVSYVSYVSFVSFFGVRYLSFVGLGVLLVLWGGMAAVSWSHLETAYDWLNLSITSMGWLQWGVISFSILYLGRKYLKEVLFVFLLFFVLGFFLGPYLEPPSDPLEHLRRIYSYCGRYSYDIPPINRGIWHYAMSAVFLCDADYTRTPELILHTIDFLYASYLGFAAAILFLVAMSSGLPARWSFFSVLSCFLFFGTSKFSYFSYYAFAASFSSMLIYWLWIAAFFFRYRWRSVVFGFLFAALALPIIWVNHTQEAAFLGLVLGVWIFLNVNRWVWPRLRYCVSLFTWRLSIGKSVYVAALLFVGFVVTQSPSFMDWLDSEKWLKGVYYRWTTNQYLLVDLFSWFHIGNFFAYRVWDTLGVLGFFPLVVAPLLWLKVLPLPQVKRTRIVLLSILPFIVFFIPLLSFFWVSSLRAAVAELIYWRMAYSSLFWLAFAAFLFGVEQRLPYVSSYICDKGFNFNKSLGKIESMWFVACLLALFFLSGISASPIYGKLDFMTLDSRPWWPEWQVMIHKVARENRIVNTDRVTALVLQDVFNYSTTHGHRDRPMNIDDREMDIAEMNQKSEYACVVNLQGFKESWVPSFTRHWQPGLSDLSKRYQFEGLSGQNLKDRLVAQDIKNCLLYK